MLWGYKAPVTTRLRLDTQVDLCYRSICLCFVGDSHLLVTVCVSCGSLFFCQRISPRPSHQGINEAHTHTKLLPWSLCDCAPHCRRGGCCHVCR